MENNNLDDLEIIELETEDGGSVKAAIIAQFAIEEDGNEYVAAISLNDEGDYDEESYVSFFRLGEEVDGECELQNIEDDDEFNMASEAFDALMDAEDEDDAE